jgi:hypothetical protein
VGSPTVISSLEACERSCGLTPLGPDSPRNFWALGKKFLKAGKILSEQRQHELEWPMYFLICQALELYLKCFLRVRGVSVKDLKDRKKFHHDLQLGFKTARELGPASIFTDEFEKWVEFVNQIYRQRDLQYTNTGRFTLADFPKLLSHVEILAVWLEGQF